MSTQEPREEQVETKETPVATAPESRQNGLVRGIAGKRLNVNGVLDLRGVPAERVAEIESLTINGVVLLDEANQGALAGVPAEINGSIVLADAALKVVVQPNMEVTPAMVEAMPGGQKMLIIGIIYVDPKVPGAAFAEKFDDLRIVGILICTAAVQGALFGKLEHTGVTVTIEAEAAHVVRSIGQTVLDEDYLSRMEDGSTYVNVGQTAIPAGVPEALVAQKIARYHNVGQTSGPKAVISLLKSRVGTDLGQFRAAEEEGA